ncbi:MAG: hypothetical protein GX442_03850 [Candidatus Riflebacteria bacterium]|nr:hypothetical protein [Candidatus Riflebacteria bacterium]
MILLVVFAYNSFTREEALRVHRIFWNDMLTKVGEGIGEEAFSWFLANPGNEIEAFLTDPATTDSQEKSLDLLGKLRFSARLGGPRVDRCQLTACRLHRFFSPPSLPADFTSVSKGVIYPDATERYALLKVEVTVSYQRYRRTYEALREVKAVNILPGVFGQFTLFVKDKKPGPTGDPNQLKTETERTSVLVMDGFADATTPLGNPLTLIHHPDDAARSTPLPAAGKVSPDWAGGVPDFTRRGWVFLGSTLRTPPFHAWILHPMQGDITPAAARPEAHRFYGGNFQLANHTVLIYHTKMPALAALSPPVPPPTVSLTAPPFNGDPGHPFIGWMIAIKRFGFLSLTPAVMQALSAGQLFGSYYDDPDHAGESTHGSLLLPFGSLYPVSGSTVADQRSPTILLGPAGIRFIQVGGIWQIDQTTSDAFAAGTDMLAAYESQAENDRSQSAYIPYFPIRGNALVPGKPDRIGWNNYLVWAAVGEKGAGNPGAFPARDWAAVNYNMLTHVLGGGMTPPIPTYYGLVMCNLILVHAMQACEQILANNMRAEANPSGWVVPPANRSVTTLPATLQPVDDAGNDTSDTAESFFFTDGGRGPGGNRLALRDAAGNRLAVGYLGALWPFSTGTVQLDTPLRFDGYDLRQKTTHLVGTPQEFAGAFLKTEGGRTVLDLQGGIVTVLGGDVHLAASGGAIHYRRSGMLIVSEGNLVLEAPLKRDGPAGETVPVTLATAQDGKHIVFATGGPIEAFLISSGTLKKQSSGGVSLFGGAAVKFLEFDPAAADSLFRGHPSSTSQRSALVWNPAFNIFDPATARRGRRLHLGSVVSYWKSGVE